MEEVKYFRWHCVIRADCMMLFVWSRCCDLVLVCLCEMPSTLGIKIVLLHIVQECAPNFLSFLSPVWLGSFYLLLLWQVLYMLPRRDKTALHKPDSWHSGCQLECMCHNHESDYLVMGSHSLNELIGGGCNLALSLIVVSGKTDGTTQFDTLWPVRE